MSKRTLQTSAAVLAIGLLLATAAAAAPRCALLRGEGMMTQPAGPFTDWVGPVTLTLRGKSYSGQGTVFIDPLMLGNSGPPNFEGTAFDWFTIDLGEVGAFSAWELASFSPLDATFQKFGYQGTGRLGPSYVAPGVYGPVGSGMFAQATGLLHSRGTMWLTFPSAPNSIDFRFSGRVCDVAFE